MEVRSTATRGNRVSATNLIGAAGGYHLKNQDGTWTVYDNVTDRVIRTNIDDEHIASEIDRLHHLDTDAHYEKGFHAGYQRAREEFLQGIVCL